MDEVTDAGLTKALVTARIRVVALEEIRKAFKELWAKEGRVEGVVARITEWHSQAEAEYQKLIDATKGLTTR